METIRKIRNARHRDHKPIREIARDLNLSRNTVRNILRSDVTELHYERNVQPMPKLEAFKASLTRMLEEESRKPKKQRRSALLLFEQLQREGFAGGYDTVRRFVKRWKQEEQEPVKAFVPLSFAPGEAFQFDWGYEQIELGGCNVRVKIAQFRLCHSRAPFCVAYLRESLEMVMDAQSGRLPRKITSTIATVWKMKSDSHQPMPVKRFRFCAQTKPITMAHTMFVKKWPMITVRISRRFIKYLEGISF